jgi:hypothetical protein
MAYKFLRGDTVRVIGTPDDHLIVREAEPGGLRYMLASSSGVVSAIGWAPEDQLELVKRASDDDTGLEAMYIR